MALVDLLKAQDRAVSPLAEKPQHFPAKAKHCVFLFMNGGPSQVDTFDPKPELTRQHGKPLPGPAVKTDSATGNLMKSPFAFKQHGQSGRWVSSVFPHIATQVDKLAFLMAVASKTNVHGPASYMMNTGFVLPVVRSSTSINWRPVRSACVSRARKRCSMRCS